MLDLQRRVGEILAAQKRDAVEGNIGVLADESGEGLPSQQAAALDEAEGAEEACAPSVATSVMTLAVFSWRGEIDA